MVSFSATISPPTHKLPPIPTPPATCNAPELVDVAEVDAITNIEFADIAFTPVMSPPENTRSPPVPATVKLPPPPPQ